jgi:hypothetical protein
MAGVTLTEQDWTIRTRIYGHFVETGKPPSYEDIAAEIGIGSEEARRAFHRLHEAHTLFLEPGDDVVRMANPFSAVPTPFRVEAGGCSYYANCAWDSLAIPAVLRRDAVIHAHLEVTSDTVEIQVVDGEPRPAEDYIVHFAVPFRHWYDDLIHN